MSDMKRTASTARRKGRIRLMDRCLLAYMAILLAQSAYSLFSAAALGTETGGIDIIVRTSTAAVFGYFLSANYRLEAAPGEDDPDNSLQVVTTAGIGLFLPADAAGVPRRCAAGPRPRRVRLGNGHTGAVSRLRLRLRRLPDSRTGSKNGI